MKYLWLLLLIAKAYSQDPDCPDNSIPEIGGLQEFAESVSIPNCLTTENFQDAKLGRTKPFCKCKTQFDRLSSRKIFHPNKEEVQKKVVDGLIQELSKNTLKQIKTFLGASKLPGTGGFPKAELACRLKTLSDFTNNCSSKAAIKLLSESKVLKELPRHAAEEYALSVDSGSLKKANALGLISRDSNESCGISETQAMLAQNLALEQFLFEKIVLKMDQILEEPGSDGFINNIRNLAGDNFYNSIKNHPFLGSILHDPAKFRSFKAMNKGAKSLESFRKNIFKNSEFRKDFDSKMAESCTNSFESIKKSLCSDDFENGQFDPGVLTNLDKSLGITAVDEEFAATPDLITKNENALAYCEWKPEKTDLNFSKISNDVGNLLTFEDQRATLMKYSQREKEDSKGLLDLMCHPEKEKCQLAENKSNLNCTIISISEKFNNPKTYESVLAKSSDKEVAKVIASTLGNQINLAPDVRKVLIEQHWIQAPEVAKSIAESPVVDRSPEAFYAKTQSAPSPIAQAPAQTAAAAAASKPASSSSRAANQPAQRDSYVPEQASTVNYPGSNPASQTSNSATEDDSEEAERRGDYYQDKLKDWAKNSKRSKKAAVSPEETLAKALSPNKAAVASSYQGKPSYGQNANNPNIPQFADMDRAEIVHVPEEKVSPEQAAANAKEKLKEEADAKTAAAASTAEAAGSMIGQGSASAGIAAGAMRGPASIENKAKNRPFEKAAVIVNEENIDVLIEQIGQGSLILDTKLQKLYNEKKHFEITILETPCQVVFDEKAQGYVVKPLKNASNKELALIRKFEDGLNRKVRASALTQTLNRI